MPPGVKRSLTEGFRVAGRSWGGMGLFVLAWLVVGAVVVAGVALTRPPAAMLEAPTAPAAAPAAEEEGAVTPATTPAETEQQRALGEWFSRSWPVLALSFIVLLAAGLLIQGGQVGYVTQQVRAGRAGWADIRGAAIQAFGSLLGAGCLSLGAVGVGVGGVALLIALLQVLPGVVAGVLGVLLLLIAVAGVVWLSLRLALWPIAIVAERVGPVAGLKASWRLSRGRFWTLLGIAGIFLAISIGVAIISSLVEGMGNLIGGGLALAVQLLNGIVGGLANLFLSFATMGALMRFHEDAKGSEGAAS